MALSLLNSGGTNCSLVKTLSRDILELYTLAPDASILNLSKFGTLSVSRAWEFNLDFTSPLLKVHLCSLILTVPILLISLVYVES